MALSGLPAQDRKPRRIGVFGGSFDPPHNAHVALVQAAIDELQLDELRVLPTGDAWHKARALTASAHRLAMTRLAFDGLPRVVVDDRELQRLGPTFTIHTLQVLQAENPGAQFYLVMGDDQFSMFRQWHQWQAILQIAIICIAARAANTAAIGQFDAYNELKSRFLMLHLPLMPVSATRIRQLLAAGSDNLQAVSHMVPAPVARYISSNRLYSSCQPDGSTPFH